jgi:hypothetical protein
LLAPVSPKAVRTSNQKFAVILHNPFLEVMRVKPISPQQQLPAFLPVSDAMIASACM